LQLQQFVATQIGNPTLGAAKVKLLSGDTSGLLWIDLKQLFEDVLPLVANFRPQILSD
jgi:hypothetical protein